MLIKGQQIQTRRAIFVCCSIAVLVGVVGLVAQADDATCVRLEGQPNFRDLGGYRTNDGRVVKSGLVFRSGELHRLSDVDVAKLERLGVKTLISFLTDSEIHQRGEPQLPENVKIIRLPIAGDSYEEGLVDIVLKSRQNADFSKVPVELNPKIHRLLIRGDGQKQYATLLQELADSENYPLVFHCSHGVHRTGTGAAIFLSALGVPWETVRQDYLLSNEYRAEEVSQRLVQIRTQAAKDQRVSMDEVDMTNANAFYILEADYIDASLDEILKQYGSMKKFIRDGLGVDDDLLKKLRDAMLEKP